MASIRFENLGKSYGDNEVIRSLNFDVKDGEHLLKRKRLRRLKRL